MAAQKCERCQAVTPSDYYATSFGAGYFLGKSEPSSGHQQFRLRLLSSGSEIQIDACQIRSSLTEAEVLRAKRFDQAFWESLEPEPQPQPKLDPSLNREYFIGLDDK